MTNNTDIVTELQAAANTIVDVAPIERRRLLICGADEVSSLRRVLLAAGQEDPEQPPFLENMPALADMAASPGAVEVLIAAGMSMLAGEIERLRELSDKLIAGGTATTLASALHEAGFEPGKRKRIIVGAGRGRETLRRRKDS